MRGGGWLWDEREGEYGDADEKGGGLDQERQA